MNILARFLLLFLAGPALAEPAVPDNPPVTAPGSASANDEKPAPEVSLADMVRALTQFLTEEETQMVYDYLWDASIAALKGDDEGEVVIPPELAFKLAILQRRIVKEGGHYLEGIARQMEKDLQNWRDNLLKPAPPVPYQLPGEAGKAPNGAGKAASGVESKPGTAGKAPPPAK